MKRTAVTLAALVLWTGLAWGGDMTPEEFQRRFLSPKDVTQQTWQIWQRAKEPEGWRWAPVMAYSFQPGEEKQAWAACLRGVQDFQRLQQSWDTNEYQCRPGYATGQQPPMGQW